VAETKLNWYGDKLKLTVKDATPDALFEGVDMLAKAAAAKAPRATGELADSGYAASETKSTYKGGSQRRKEIKPEPGTAVAAFSAFYSRFIELGTRKRAARPFLRPAFDELKDQIAQAVADSMRKKVDK
jgi:HK97 gp10 family phage protein